MTRVSERVHNLLIAGAFAICLVAGSTPRIVGDGGEYLVQALNFSQLNSPPLGRRAIASIQPEVLELAPHLVGWDIQQASVAAGDRSRDFLHFWFYALLATPPLWIMEAVGASPLHAFTLLNLALLAIALSLALPRIGRWPTVLLFAGPLVWWIDKAHTEVFTVSLLSIAVLTLRDRPWWSLIAAGAASTQNPPITAVFLMILAVEIARRRATLFSDRRAAIGALIGLALAALAPVYTYVRHGTPSLLLYATRPGLPTWAEISAAVLDPSMGLIGNYPLFAIAALVAAVWLSVRHPRAWLTPETLVTAVSALVFLYSFARTSNMHHGATPSLTRYALWLIPMSLPLWIAVRDRIGAAGRAALTATAVASALISVFAFHPRVPDNSREPTWLAMWLWNEHPGWHNPLPEVFSETHLHREGTRVPVATLGCNKILIAGSSSDEGAWPLPCLPAPLPGDCRAPDVMCYANRNGDTYDFVRAPGRESEPGRMPEALWPRGSEETVRRIYAASGWPAMADQPTRIVALRAQLGVRIAAFGTDEKFLLVLRQDAAGAVLRFRSTHELTGEIVDVVNGQVLSQPHFAGPADQLWELPVPVSQSGVVILTMNRGAEIE